MKTCLSAGDQQVRKARAPHSDKGQKRPIPAAIPVVGTVAIPVVGTATQEPPVSAPAPVTSTIVQIHLHPRPSIGDMDRFCFLIQKRVVRSAVGIKYFFFPKVKAFAK